MWMCAGVRRLFRISCIGARPRASLTRQCTLSPRALIAQAYKERVRDLEEQLAASKRLHAGLAAQVDGLKHANDMDDASLEQLKHVVADVKRKQANEVGDASDRAARGQG